MKISTFDEFKSIVANKKVVLFAYPKLGKSGAFLPQNLKSAPAMTGCSAQASGYESLLKEFKSLGYEVMGLSSQDELAQNEFKSSLGLSFEVICDSDFILAKPLELELIHTTDSACFYRRQTLVLDNGAIIWRHIANDSEKDAQIILNLLKSLS